MQHFKDLTAGCSWQDQPSGLAAALESQRRRCDERRRRMPLLSFETAPAPSEAVALMARGKARGAAGMDSLGALVFKCDPALFGALYLPLFLKAAVRFEEPLQWKGGSMCTIPKAAAVGGQRVKDYRGVLVASVVGKKLHSFWRKGLDPILARRAAGTMCGGIDGRATNIASHIARLTIATSKAKSHSVALLFADLV